VSCNSETERNKDKNAGDVKGKREQPLFFRVMETNVHESHYKIRVRGFYSDILKKIVAQ